MINDVGQLIRNSRIYRDMTQQDLAIACGLRRETVNRIEHGLQMPSLDALIRIADILECDVKVLYLLREEHK